MLGIVNIADPENWDLKHHTETAIKAHALYRRDSEYVVKDGEVIIVDEFTGRMMPGRRWSDGLHQAVEAKENVKIERENQTLATISFQNYFRMYGKLAGMTGTAEFLAKQELLKKGLGHSVGAAAGELAPIAASASLTRFYYQNAEYEVDAQQWEEALARFQGEIQAEHDKVVGVGGLHILGTERHES